MKIHHNDPARNYMSIASTIAAALGVSQNTIALDLKALKERGKLSTVDKSGQRQGRPPIIRAARGSTG